MNLRKQIPSRQTASRSARNTRACSFSLRKWFMSFDKGWNVSKTMIYFAIAVLGWNTGNLGYAAQTTDSSPGEDRPFDHVVTGTLDQLDFDAGKGLLKTDLGKPIFFDMVRPELFRRLSVGQRVTIGMNEQGQAVKVMETAPVELATPPSATQ